MKLNFALLTVVVFILSACEKKVLQYTPIAEVENLTKLTESKFIGIDKYDDHLLAHTFHQIFKSTDNGRTWEEIPKPSASINKVKFLNKDTIYLASTGRIYTTFDGGENWFSKKTSGTITDIDIYDGIAYATSTSSYSESYIYVCDGYYWTVIFKGDYVSSLATINVLDENHIIAAGTDRVYCHDGKTFKTVSLSGLNIIDSYFTEIEEGRLVGYELEKYDPDVLTHNIRDFFDKWEFRNKKIKFYKDSGKGVIVGEKTILKRSDDGTWVYLYNSDGSTIPYNYNDFVFLSENVILAVGYDGVMSKIQL